MEGPLFLEDIEYDSGDSWDGGPIHVDFDMDDEVPDGGDVESESDEPEEDLEEEDEEIDEEEEEFEDSEEGEGFREE